MAIRYLTVTSHYQNISLVSPSAGSPFFDIVGAASVPYKNSFLMVGGYSYEVDGDYIDLVHYYDPESKSIIPLEGRLQTKKGVLYDNSIIFIAYFLLIQFDIF